MEWQDIIIKHKNNVRFIFKLYYGAKIKKKGFENTKAFE